MDVLAGLICALTMHINSLYVLKNVHSLGIEIRTKVSSALIYLLGAYIFLRMLYLMKTYFPSHACIAMLELVSVLRSFYLSLCGTLRTNL
jgi:hypothetical protein